MNIFFDLDGTLLDSRDRLYQLFQTLVNESNFTFEQYWELKRNKVTHKQILTDTFFYSNGQIAEFEKKWMSNIELPQWLDLDKPIEGVTSYLKDLKIKQELYIITARQSENNVLEQISKYEWSDLFNRILVTKRRGEKYDLLKNEVRTQKDDWIVGDTGNDIEVGKKLGINTAAVLSGFSNREQLIKYQPDIIIENITKLKV
jgi:phosphoglycolate phosphatase